MRSFEFGPIWFTTCGGFSSGAYHLASIRIWHFGIVVQTFGIRFLLGKWGKWNYPELLISFPWRGL